MRFILLASLASAVVALRPMQKILRKAVGATAFLRIFCIGRSATTALASWQAGRGAFLPPSAAVLQNACRIAESIIAAIKC